MKSSIMLILLSLLALKVTADLPYIPLELKLEAFKLTVLEGERIGFKVHLINKSPNAIMVLHPANQNSGQKLISFNLYKRSEKGFVFLEAESRDMMNAMPHGPFLYPEKVEIKAYDSLSFEVFFNGDSWMKTENHHWFNKVKLLAGQYQFQCIYNPFGTLTGDSLFSPISSTHEEMHDSDKMILWSNGLPSFPLGITILHQGNQQFNLQQGKVKSIEQPDGSTAYFLDDETQAFKQEVLAPDLIYDSTKLHSQRMVLAPFYHKKSSCGEHCHFCDAIVMRDFSYIEALINRKIRAYRKEPGGMGPLMSWLNSHHRVAYAKVNSSSLASLPSNVNLTIGFMPDAYTQTPYHCSIQTGRNGRIPYYRFKGGYWTKRSDIDFLKMKYFEEDSILIAEADDIHITNFQSAKNGVLPVVKPSAEYLFTQDFFACAAPSQMDWLLNCCFEQVRQEKVKNTGYYVYLLCDTLLERRFYTLNSLPEDITLLPYLMDCANVFANLPEHTFLSNTSMAYLQVLRQKIELISGFPVYDPNPIEQNPLAMIKKACNYWNNRILSVQRIQTEIMLEVLEAQSLD